MIHAGTSELKKAFRQHKNCSEECTAPSSYLLLFYAVECGIKSILYRDSKLKDHASDKQLYQSHDLIALVKELKLPTSMTNVNTTFHLKKDRQSWEIRRAHEAWRYGVVIDKNDETQLVNWLKQVAKWIKENI